MKTDVKIYIEMLEGLIEGSIRAMKSTGLQGSANIIETTYKEIKKHRP